MRLMWFGAAIAAAFVPVIAFHPFSRAGPRARAAALAVVTALALATPYLIPAEAKVLRLLAAISAVTAAIKLFDLHLGASRGDVPRFWPMLAFFANVFCLVHRRLRDLPAPAGQWRRLGRALLLFVPGMALFVAAFTVDWRRYGFAAEHTAKVVTFFLAIVPGTEVLGAAWGLLGGRGLRFMDNPFAANTPADFWRRYNRPVHQYLQEDVFLPSGGRRHPFRGAILVFLVSALIHEYVFTVPVGRVQGYQTAFFLLQGLAVAMTMRVKPRGCMVVPCVAATFAFNVASGVLFFASINSVLPFYVNPVPVWVI